MDCEFVQYATWKKIVAGTATDARYAAVSSTLDGS
jgi:hypothetical protein